MINGYHMSLSAVFAVLLHIQHRSGLIVAFTISPKINVAKTASCLNAAHVSDRRVVFTNIFGAVFGLSSGILLSAPSSSFAEEIEGLYLAQPMGPTGESSRPTAPIEYLVPAARVGFYIHQALAIVEDIAQLANSSKDDERQKRIDDNIAKLDILFAKPPSFIKSSDPSVNRRDPYTNSIPILGEIGTAAQKQKERKDRSIEVGLAPQFFEVGELVGERRQWNQLQKAESARENASEVRRAFNIYTTNLNFNRNKYEWTGSKEEKSKMIRDEKLPTTTDVIRSDLDARDLFRNQIQTSLEDSKAEYLYQIKEKDNGRSFDATELSIVLREAQVAVDKWFNFIPDSDAKRALEIVRLEPNQY